MRRIMGTISQGYAVRNVRAKGLKFLLRTTVYAHKDAHTIMLSIRISCVWSVLLVSVMIYCRMRYL